MVAINFKKQFVADVESCRKQNTIRAKARCKPGDKLQLYYGMRTKVCRKIMDATCLNVQPIVIVSAGHVRLNGFSMNEKDLQAFARADGFANSADMAEFFDREHDGLPFAGYLISWIPEIKNAN